MKLQQNTRQLQKQILAPVMQQSIELLQLPIGELNSAIESEMESNPVLESDDMETTLSRYIKDVVHNKHSADNNSFRHVSGEFFSDDDIIEDKQITQTIKLEDHLAKQLHVDFNDPLDITIGELIITQINEDGYFEGNIFEITETLKLTDTTRVETVLKKIQNFDPLGIGARHLRECLLVQVDSRFNGHAPLIIEIINDHLNNLALKKFELIAKKLKITTEQVRALAKLIATLEPKPGRMFADTPANLYVRPDIFITEEDGQFVATVNNDYIPQLRVSTSYKSLLKRKNTTSEETNFIKEKIKNALMFIKSIEQRQTTIKQIADYIATEQQQFFKEGYQALKPMTLHDIATAIDRNESTISRAINNKHLDSPQGIFPLKYFFSQAINNKDKSSTVSNRSVKEELMAIVEDENKTQPYSDQEILEILSKRKMKIARRTISKYRKELKILPSHLRRA